VAYNNVYFVIQTIQAPDQTIDREFSDATGDERRNVRLFEPKHGCGLGLGQLPALDIPRISRMNIARGPKCAISGRANRKCLF
jgi:hypothetical protein